MKYSIEIGKILEGAIKNDFEKVKSYSNQLIKKLNEDGDIRTANKFERIISMQTGNNLSPMGLNITKNLPVDSESRNELAEMIYPDKNEIKVSLTKKNMNQIDDFILNYQNADRLHEAGVGVANALLLFGPPGCGKSKSAFLIAQKLNLPLVIARLDSLISSYLGTTAKNIRTLFEFVQKIPCVLFLDEFDAIAKARDDNNELGELKRVVNSLLQNIDNMSSESLIIAATNHENLLDTAVWRRFDYKIEIELPDQNSIEEMIDIFMINDYKISDQEKIELAEAFVGRTGAEVEGIIKKAIRDSVIHQKNFSYKSVFDELFLFWGLINNNVDIDKDILTERAKHLRNINPKTFSYSRIAEILDVSKSHVANMLKEV